MSLLSKRDVLLDLPDVATTFSHADSWYEPAGHHGVAPAWIEREPADNNASSRDYRNSDKESRCSSEDSSCVLSLAWRQNAKCHGPKHCHDRAVSRRFSVDDLHECGALRRAVHFNDSYSIMPDSHGSGLSLLEHLVHLECHDKASMASARLPYGDVVFTPHIGG